MVAVVGVPVSTSSEGRVRTEESSDTARSLISRVNKVEIGRMLSPTKSVFVGGALLGEDPAERISGRDTAVVGVK